MGTTHANRPAAPAFLLHDTVFLLTKIAGRLLYTRAGITFPQFLLLHCVQCHPDAAQCDVARFREVSDAAVSRLTTCLVRRGLLRRQKSRNRRRARLLELTENGGQLLLRCDHLLQREFGSLFNVLQRSEQRTFLRVLVLLHNAAHHRAATLGCIAR